MASGSSINVTVHFNKAVHHPSESLAGSFFLLVSFPRTQNRLGLLYAPTLVVLCLILCAASNLSFYSFLQTSFSVQFDLYRKVLNFHREFAYSSNKCSSAWTTVQRNKKLLTPQIVLILLLLSWSKILLGSDTCHTTLQSNLVCFVVHWILILRPSNWCLGLAL